VIVILVSSVWSWFHYHEWVATWLAAIATALALLAAGYIGLQAGRISRSQKELAGIQQLNDYMNQFESPEMVRVRRQIADDWLDGRTDPVALGKVLDFLDDLASYPIHGYLPIAILDDRFGFAIICTWYAALPIIDPQRGKSAASNVWLNVQQAVKLLHKYNRKDGELAWASRPSQEEMDGYFNSVLEMTEEPK
jgi:hypothetical protein